jgi:hypothetical protein
MPNAAHYAATKAYVQTLAEALHVELRSRGVDVLAAAPGPTDSGFADRADMRMGRTLSTRAVAQGTLAALGRRPTALPGLLSRVLRDSLAPLPQRARVRIMGSVMAGMTRHQRTDTAMKETGRLSSWCTVCPRLPLWDRLRSHIPADPPRRSCRASAVCDPRASRRRLRRLADRRDRMDRAARGPGRPRLGRRPHLPDRDRPAPTCWARGPPTPPIYCIPTTCGTTWPAPGRPPTRAKRSGPATSPAPCTRSRPGSSRGSRPRRRAHPRRHGRRDDGPLRARSLPRRPRAYEGPVHGRPATRAGAERDCPRSESELE